MPVVFDESTAFPNPRGKVTIDSTNMRGEVFTTEPVQNGKITGLTTARSWGARNEPVPEFNQKQLDSIFGDENTNGYGGRKNKPRRNLMKKLKSMSSRAIPVVKTGLEDVGTFVEGAVIKSVPLVKQGVSGVYGTMAKGVNLGAKSLKLRTRKRSRSRSRSRSNARSRSRSSARSRKQSRKRTLTKSVRRQRSRKGGVMTRAMEEKKTLENELNNVESDIYYYENQFSNAIEDEAAGEDPEEYSDENKEKYFEAKEKLAELYKKQVQLKSDLNKE